MDQKAAIAVVGTFDSKGEEHLFLKERIEQRGLHTITVNIGTKAPPTFEPDIDLYPEIIRDNQGNAMSRDLAIQDVIRRGRELVKEQHQKGKIRGMISAGGGTGTHMATSIMRVLPLGIPKVMVSTVASRNMAGIVGTKDITMIHSVSDILGVNSISGGVLDRAAGAVCGMTQSGWATQTEKKRIALTMFGFITKAAESIKGFLEEMGYEVIAFHANGTGGMAMEELAAEGHFHGILDLAIHELADEFMGGYCAGIGPERLGPVPGVDIPRLVVPGGMDCAVLEFTRDHVPEEFQDRKIFYYDFRSAIRLNREETLFLASQLAAKLSVLGSRIRVLIPTGGWSEADREGGPLYDPAMRDVFIEKLRQDVNPHIRITEVDSHINDTSFAELCSRMMHEMLQTRP